MSESRSAPENAVPPDEQQTADSYKQALALIQQESQKPPEKQEWQPIITLLKVARKYDSENPEILNQLSDVMKIVTAQKTFLASLREVTDYVAAVDGYLSRDQSILLQSHHDLGPAWWQPWTWGRRRSSGAGLPTKVCKALQVAEGAGAILPHASQDLYAAQAKFIDVVCRLEERINFRLMEAKNAVEDISEARQSVLKAREILGPRQLDGKVEDVDERIGKLARESRSHRRSIPWPLIMAIIAGLPGWLAALLPILFGPNVTLPSLYWQLTPASISRVEVYKNNTRLDLQQGPFDVTYGQQIHLEVDAFDSNAELYDSDDLECKWTVAPSDPENWAKNEDLSKSAECQALYTPTLECNQAQKCPQKVSVQIKGFKDRRREIVGNRAISIRFNIVK
jgi:hypothetical protein